MIKIADLLAVRIQTAAGASKPNGVELKHESNVSTPARAYPSKALAFKDGQYVVADRSK